VCFKPKQNQNGWAEVTVVYQVSLKYVYFGCCSSRQTERQIYTKKLINVFQNMLLRHLKCSKISPQLKLHMYFISSLSYVIHRWTDRHDKIIMYPPYFFFRKKPKIDRKSCVKLNKYMYFSVGHGLQISEEKWSCF
jgi:hypothetical protein